MHTLTDHPLIDCYFHLPTPKIKSCGESLTKCTSTSAVCFQDAAKHDTTQTIGANHASFTHKQIVFDNPLRTQTYVKISLHAFSKSECRDCFRLVCNLLHNLSNLLQPSYTNQPFTKTALNLARIAGCIHHAKLNKSISNISLVTVPRSPFVFKKTREQFGISSHTYYTHIKISHKNHTEMLLTGLYMLKLPCEVKIDLYTL